MSLHRRIKYISPILLFLGVAALLYIKLHGPPPKQSLFNNYSPSSDGKLWTVIGSANSDIEAYVGIDGSYQPGKQHYSAHWYVYDCDSRRLLKPTRSRRSLMDGHLPAPIVEWTDAGISAKITTFVITGKCFSSITLRNNSNRSRRLTMFLAALPYGVTGKIRDGESLLYDRDRRAVTVGNHVFLYCDDKPQGFGAILSESASDNTLTDITSYIQNGRLPMRGSVESSRECGTSGAVGYEIRIEPGKARTLAFRSPMTDGRQTQSPTYREARKLFRKFWTNQTGHVKLSLPDKRYTQCFYASLAYLMILSDGGAPRPGSAIYEPFWVRDNAYITDALYYAGRSDLAAKSLKHLAAMHLPNGGFRAHTGAGDSEYDAPGEAIYTFAQYYRRTGDIEMLRKSWPVIVSASRYLKSKRLSGADGILPPSLSAEDLGSEKQQHYWDDFWAIRGLNDAAYIADTLGHQDDAKWIRRESDTLLDATWASIKNSREPGVLDYIPNGPQDLTSSAMARGTSCGVWPCAALDASDPFVRSSFEVYWKKWIEPHNGGFQHNGEYWPYAGLDLAMDYLILDQPERAASILRWTIDHDPTSGFYSWPEGMNVKDFTLAAGDMPHGWTSASYICLIRNLLVRESGKDVIIASGVPVEWLAPGCNIEIDSFPTTNGAVGYKLSASSDAIRISLRASGAKMCRIRLPESIKVTGLSADGCELTSFSGNKCSFTAAFRDITMRIRR
ncbi:MAG: hypothetical protein ABFD49_09405 [Armatimonadota bacterium]|nr:hypothetical protein [bacterium]